MPLNEGAKSGSKGFGENVATEIRAGKKQEQAVAIAYRESGEKNDADETSSYKGHEIEKRGETYYISKNGRRSTGYWDSLNSARIAVDKGLLKSLEKNDASLLMDAVAGLRGKVEVVASKVDGLEPSPFDREARNALISTSAKNDARRKDDVPPASHLLKEKPGDPLWKITGISMSGGRPVTVKVRAKDYDEARQNAGRRGIKIESVVLQEG